MKVKALEVVTVRVPVASPTRISTRLLTKREFVLVRVRNDHDATVGVGYTYVGTAGGRVVAAAVESLLSPVVIGRDASDIVGAWEAMYQETLLHGRSGAVMRAIAAVDIALWDLHAKRADLPLGELLGGGAARPIPAYASGGYYKNEDGDWLEALRVEIKQNVDNGFSDHKIKVGGLSVAQDAQRVATAVEAMGAGGRLALDANNAYRDASQAAAALRAFEASAGSGGLWWFEEPLSPDNVRGHSVLARGATTAIATGEIASSRFEFADLLHAGAADILQPDAGVLGGVTEFLRVANLVSSFGLQVAPHWHANLHVHLASAIPNCVSIEHFDLEKDIYNFERLLKTESRLKFDAGHVVANDRPGLGLTWDEDQVERLAID